jgi:hypothetical protein
VQRSWRHEDRSPALGDASGADALARKACWSRHAQGYSPPVPSPVAAFNNAQAAPQKKICAALAKHIDRGLPKAEKKVWHGAPVWFIDGNPLVGYSVRKASVVLLFWSGRSFDEPDLLPEGKFKAAHVRYASLTEIDVTSLARWLRKAKKMQWDYKNIAKRRGVLEKIGDW